MRDFFARRRAIAEFDRIDREEEERFLKRASEVEQMRKENFREHSERPNLLTEWKDYTEWIEFLEDHAAFARQSRLKRRVFLAGIPIDEAHYKDPFPKRRETPWPQHRLNPAGEVILLKQLRDQQRESWKFWVGLVTPVLALCISLASLTVSIISLWFAFHKH